MEQEHAKIAGILLIEEIEETIRLGKLVNKLEKRIRRLKRKSASQHRALSVYRNWYGQLKGWEEGQPHVDL